MTVIVIGRGRGVAVGVGVDLEFQRSIAAGVRSHGRQSTPDDHFTASPDCGVKTRAAGALVVLVAVQLSVLGSYLPPVFEQIG